MSTLGPTTSRKRSCRPFSGLWPERSGVAAHVGGFLGAELRGSGMDLGLATGLAWPCRLPDHPDRPAVQAPDEPDAD